MIHHAGRVSLDNTCTWFCVQRELVTESGNNWALNWYVPTNGPGVYALKKIKECGPDLDVEPYKRPACGNATLTTANRCLFVLRKSKRLKLLLKGRKHVCLLVTTINHHSTPGSHKASLEPDMQKGRRGRRPRITLACITKVSIAKYWVRKKATIQTKKSPSDWSPPHFSYIVQCTSPYSICIPIISTLTSPYPKAGTGKRQLTATQQWIARQTAERKLPQE